MLARAAITHAQSESTRRCTDANGHIGRAVINAVGRRRGITRRVIVPIAAAFVAHRDRYSALLDDGRTGYLSSLATAFSGGTRVEAIEEVGGPRRGSPTRSIDARMLASSAPSPIGRRDQEWGMLASLTERDGLGSRLAQRARAHHQRASRTPVADAGVRTPAMTTAYVCAHIAQEVADAGRTSGSAVRSVGHIPWVRSCAGAQKRQA